MIQEKSWQEFRSTGLGFFVNQILHLFGWALVFEMDENNSVVRTFPARCAFRGFSDEVQDKGYKDITEYLINNVEELKNEVNK